jgi:hypothetical protein
METENAIRFTVISIKAVKPSNTRAIPMGNFQLPTLYTRVPFVTIVHIAKTERANKMSVVMFPITSGIHFNFLPIIEIINAPNRDIATKSGII